MLKFSLALVCVIAISCYQVATDTLILVQMVHRHGDRSPDSPIPNDVNNEYWLTVTNGWGMLTNIGKQQLYQLGQYTRQRFPGYFNDSYLHKEILINCTDKDRTLMSAYCNLAGLYPPVGNQIWDSEIEWQPIPVHTRPIPDDHIVSPDSNCPKFDELFNLVKISPELQQINTDNAQLYEYVTNNTFYPVTDIFNLYDVTDALICDIHHNFSIPEWVGPVWDQMLYLYELSFYYEYSLPQLSRLRAGPLLGHMIDNMKLARDNSLDGKKAFFFSSHDTMLTSFLSVLGMDNLIPPPFASAIFVEFYHLDNGDYGVEVYYRNDSRVDPYHMTIAGCSSPCPLDQLIELTKDQIPRDIVSECYLAEPQASKSWFARVKSYFDVSTSTD
ncbi:mitochondrial acyl carrier protein [Chamberlinius hualienensis]